MKYIGLAIASTLFLFGNISCNHKLNIEEKKSNLKKSTDNNHLKCDDCSNSNSISLLQVNSNTFGSSFFNQISKNGPNIAKVIAINKNYPQVSNKLKPSKTNFIELNSKVSQCAACGGSKLTDTKTANFNSNNSNNKGNQDRLSFIQTGSNSNLNNRNKRFHNSIGNINSDYHDGHQGLSNSLSDTALFSAKAQAEKRGNCLNEDDVPVNGVRLLNTRIGV